MRSIKTVIHENGLEVQKVSFTRKRMWLCSGKIAGILCRYSGETARDAVNHWLDARDFHDPPASASRSASITSQE